MARKLVALTAHKFGMARVSASAHTWLEAEKEAKRLQPDTCGPVGLLVTVRDPAYAKMIENAIPGWVMYAFVVSHPNDKKLILGKRFADPTNGGKPTALSVLEVRASDINSELNQNKHPISPAHLKELEGELGPLTWADEEIECPLNMRAGLMRNAWLNMALLSKSPDVITRFNSASKDPSSAVSRLLPEGERADAHVWVGGVEGWPASGH